jgi:hypothetical protein
MCAAKGKDESVQRCRAALRGCPQITLIHAVIFDFAEQPSPCACASKRSVSIRTQKVNAGGTDKCSGQFL